MRAIELTSGDHAMRLAFEPSLRLEGSQAKARFALSFDSYTDRLDGTVCAAAQGASHAFRFYVAVPEWAANQTLEADFTSAGDGYETALSRRDGREPGC